MTSLHVTPENDLVSHQLNDECVCGPRVEWFDPDTGEAYDGSLVVHHSLDGREHREA